MKRIWERIVKAENIYEVYNIFAEEGEDKRPHGYLTRGYIEWGEEGKTKIESSPKRLARFLMWLAKNHPEECEKICGIRFEFWIGNEFRGSGGDRSFIYLSEPFSHIRIKESFFDWIDVGWGDYVSSLIILNDEGEEISF